MTLHFVSIASTVNPLGIIQLGSGSDDPTSTDHYVFACELDRQTSTFGQQGKCSCYRPRLEHLPYDVCRPFDPNLSKPRIRDTHRELSNGTKGPAGKLGEFLATIGGAISDY